MQTRSPGEAPSPLDSRNQASVLLVDDRADNLLALEAILADFPVALVKARSGEEALARLLEHDFAVILLDVQMRGMNGFETAKVIRTYQRMRNTPIIFVTGFDGQGPSAEDAYALGAVDYLVKPLIPVILRAKVAGFVELFLKTEQIKRQAEQLRQMERKLADEALRESEQRFTRFMQHLPGLAWIKDLEGRYMYVNEAAERAFGVSSRELCGKTDGEVFPAETAASFQDHDRQALASPSGVQVIETLRHPDGSMHQSIVGKFAIPGADGRTAFVGGMAIDITDRLRAEEALKEADRLKDEFLAMLAHELRNPLAPLQNALKVMAFPAADATVVSEACEMAQRQVRHMARLLDDLLDVSRISRGRIELRREVFDLGAVIIHTVDSLRSSIDEKGLRLEFSLPREEITLHGDPTRIEQVVTNLLNNAVKYTDPGGAITLAVEREQGDIVIGVRDTGIGIAPDMITRIFDLFVQADRRLNRSQGGIGIGLTLTRKLVELHGGTVTASSAGPGRGSEFVVRLPACQDARSAVKTDMFHEAVAAPRRRVLIVDDNVDSALSLGMLLKLQGHQIQTANDGATALRIVAQFDPQIMFLDLGMPVIDGYEIARRLRERPESKKLFLVALTGWGQDDDRRRTREAGFNAHVVKPIQSAELQSLLAGLDQDV
jgi:PAS domain S-box-containing protein